MNGLIKSPTFEKKFEREFFGGGIPSFLENSYLECEENVRTFPSSFRLVPHNVSGILPTLWLPMWQECEKNVSLNEDAFYSYYGPCNQYFIAKRSYNIHSTCNWTKITPGGVDDQIRAIVGNAGVHSRN